MDLWPVASIGDHALAAAYTRIASRAFTILWHGHALVLQRELIRVMSPVPMMQSINIMLHEPVNIVMLVIRVLIVVLIVVVVG